MRSRLLVTPAVIILVVSTDTLAQSMQGSWQIVPSPNGGPQPPGNTLLDVVAIAPTDAWAVGFHYNPAYCTLCPTPLVIHWDGAAWSLVSTPTIAVPKVQLNSVAAVSSNDVWAVGSYDRNCGLCGDTLIEHWNGTSWSIVPSPNPGITNFLNGVAAVSADDVWAVGYEWITQAGDIAPIILHYDGQTWTSIDQSHLLTGQLSSVFALASNDVWAVGLIGLNNNIPGGALALHWDGTSWTRVVVPTDPTGYLTFRDVSGVAPDDVWAVGVVQSGNISGHTESNARAYRWDGTSWTSVLPGAFGRDSRLNAVHAVSSNDVWAVGGEPGPIGSGVAFRYVTVHWDGASWSNVPNPNQGVLHGVGASSSSDVWAVGYGFDSLGFSTGTYTLRFVCYANCDGSTAQPALTVSDFGCFLNRFAAGDPRANCDQSTTAPILNVGDFSCFLNRFAAGCP